jgi:hypothetical protein
MTRGDSVRGAVCRRPAVSGAGRLVTVWFLSRTPEGPPLRPCSTGAVVPLTEAAVTAGADSRWRCSALPWNGMEDVQVPHSPPAHLSREHP